MRGQDTRLVIDDHRERMAIDGLGDGLFRVMRLAIHRFFHPHCAGAR